MLRRVWPLVTVVGVLALSDARSAVSSPGTASPVPTLGQSESLSLVSGTVSVRVRGSTSYTPLLGEMAVPDDSEVDARHGSVAITVATPPPAQSATAIAYQGRFLLHQDATPPAEAHLILSQALAGCGAAGPLRKAHKPRAAETRKRKSVAKSRHLWVSDTGGSWGTSGRYVSTTVEGTRWLTSDQCRQSKVAVAEGVVLVQDLIHGTSASISAGHEYVATQPPIERAGHVPRLGDVLTGETGGDPAAFQRQVGKHVGVFGFFGSWGAEVAPLLSYTESIGARLLLHLSTDVGYGGAAGQQISPAEIAQGQGDGYLTSLCEELATSEAPVYLALLPEMNQANNAYSAFNANGSSRSPANSTAAFRQAWRRSVLVLRGGSVTLIDQRLRALHLPPLRTHSTTLPVPEVSFLWAPQTAGTPDTPANAPAAYYPGSAYVDIIGTDFYSAFPNFAGLQALYAAYPSKPFGFNEWAMWKSGDPGFVKQLFAFVRSHRRVALMAYNEGLSANGPFRLKRFPAATSELRRQLRAPNILGYDPSS
jgi:hypothetical protein